MILTGYGTKSDTIRDVKLKGISVLAYLTASFFSSDVGTDTIDFSKAIIKLVLNRDGKQFMLVNDDLKKLGLASSLNSINKRTFYQALPYCKIYTSSSPTIKGISSFNFDIDFKQTIHLKESDFIYIEIITSTGLYTSQVDVNQSYLDINPILSTQQEVAVPYIKTIAFPQGETRRSEFLGDNVTDIVLLNYDKTNKRSHVVNNLQLSSDKLNLSTDKFGLSMLDLRHKDFPSYVQDVYEDYNLEFDQSYIIIKDEDLDNVKLDLSLNGSNVNPSNNYLVYWTYYTDQKTLVQAETQLIVAQNEKFKTLKPNV